MGLPVTNRLLSLMPVYNEADRYLEDVLRHWTDILGKENVFVYDDRSEDKSFEIVSDMGIVGITREPEVPSFTQHEGGFRQWGWSMFETLMKPERGDWVLAQDADEKLYGTEYLPRLLQMPVDVLGVRFLHMWDRAHYRIDKAWAPNISSRLFRYLPGGAFSSRRLACGSEPDYVQASVRAGRVQWQTPLVMQHLGYMDDADKQAKYVRYSTLDKGEFHSNAHIESIIDPNPTLAPWTLS